MIIKKNVFELIKNNPLHYVYTDIYNTITLSKTYSHEPIYNNTVIPELLWLYCFDNTPDILNYIFKNIYLETLLINNCLAYIHHCIVYMDNGVVYCDCFVLKFDNNKIIKLSFEKIALLTIFDNIEDAYIKEYIDVNNFSLIGVYSLNLESYMYFMDESCYVYVLLWMYILKKSI